MRVEERRTGKLRSDRLVTPSSGTLSTDAPTRLRTRDPILFAVSALATAVFAIQGFDAPLERDASLFAYGAQQAIDGVPPYESVFTRTGPLGHLLPVPGALAARLIGLDELIGMRVVYFMLSVLAVSAMYLLGRELFRSTWVGVTAAVALLSFDQFLLYASAGPREKTAMVFFVIAALLAAARRKWFVAGVLSSLAGLTWQPSLLILVSCALVALLQADTAHRWNPLRSVVLGATLPAAITVAYFAIEGALPASVDGYLLAHLRYTTPIGLSFVDRLVLAVEITRTGYPMTALLIALGLAAMLAMVVWRVRSRTQTQRLRDDRFLVVIVAFVLSIAWTLFDLQGPPDLMFILPYAALGAGFFVHLARSSLSARKGLILASAIIGVIVVLSLSISLSTPSTRLADQQRSVDQMVSQLPIGAEVLSMGAPQPLFLDHRMNRTALSDSHSRTASISRSHLARGLIWIRGRCRSRSARGHCARRNGMGGQGVANLVESKLRRKRSSARLDVVRTQVNR